MQEVALSRGTLAPNHRMCQNLIMTTITIIIIATTETRTFRNQPYS